jgi:F-type H+-transporting ATPase subunit delta
VSKGSIKIARRYARALIGVYEPSKLDSIRIALNETAKTYEEIPSLQHALQNPGFSITERQSVLKTISQKIIPGNENFSNFLSLLLESGRIASIKQIATQFSIMLDDLRKLLALKVTSACKVSESEMKEFKSSIEKQFGSLASVEWFEDKNLIGGLKINAGDRLLDGSVRGSLDRLQASLMTS